MYRLVAKSGLTRGVSWPVGDGTISIGRDKSCEVYIDDPLISRRHCEISVVGETLLLVDLGSRNTTLVNRKPTERGQLYPGDEIALGNVVLVVAQERLVPPAISSPEQPSTITIPMAQALYVQGSQADLLTTGAYQTVQDLVALYTYSRDFHLALTKDDVLARLEACLVSRYKPANLWIGTLDPDGGISFRVVCGSASAPSDMGLGEMAAKSVKQNAALLAPLPGSPRARNHRNAMATTLTVGDKPYGAVCAVSPIDGPHFDENSLQMMIGIVSAAAPWYVALERQEALELERNALRRGASGEAVLVGQSEAVNQARQLAHKAGQSTLPVLLQGETGTGKELVAHLIHEFSSRRQAPFIAVNCAALPSDLILAELFGHERGAYTGATRAREGLFAASHGGTLFLDEIGDLPADHQAVLLRVLETGRYRRVGGTREYTVDFRVVTATNRPLTKLVETGSFRQDLYHRIAGFVITLPPLRERAEDIPDLVEHFFEEARRHAGRKLRGVDPAAIMALQRCAWPGNVRELKMAVERAIYLAQGETVALEDFQLADRPAAEQILPMDEAERIQIQRALAICGGNVQLAAERLGIGRSTFYKKLRRYSIAKKDSPA